MNLTDKIGIAGGGVEGLALAEYLAGRGYADVTIFDEKEDFHEAVTKTIEVICGTDSAVRKVLIVCGEGAFGKMGDCAVVFRSPGVHPKKLEALRKTGGGTGVGKSVPLITGTTQFFLENCPCRVIGVTGTKGKGTTSTLIYQMLKEAGRDVYLGGNIGQSPLTFLDRLKADSLVVLELSSFQLQDLTVSPSVAVVLRTTSEHLDYHAHTAEYRAAKMPIVRFQKPEDVVVMNKDYEYYREYMEAGAAKKMFVSMKADMEGEGAHLDGPMIVNCKGAMCEMIGDSGKVALPGRFNLENILPAVVVARYFDVPIPAIQKVIYSFAGLPHRLEFVREYNNIKYYNDSFSTTPETSIAAVYAFDAPVLLIAGGSEKNSDYTEWAMELQKNHQLKMVFLMGVTADRMERALLDAAEKLKGMDIMGEFPVKIRRCATLEDAVMLAAKLALPGETVIMSPAAASFDQFKNYKCRGEAFRKIVAGI